MLTKDMHKNEVEGFLEGKGDFVCIDYLTRYLKLMPPIEMRKFAYLKLAEIYLEKSMFSSAAEAFKNAALNSVPFREKQNFYLNEAKAWISAFDFDKSDKALKRAMDEANNREKEEIYREFISSFNKEMQKIENSTKYGHLMKLYEKFLKLKISNDERERTKEKLLKIYEKLGKIKEYKLLENS